ncbi:MAG: hypothetical protein KBD16_00510 [Candidatus Pacebacteria bacterium]|nr:hypothetical protein [Candidatus Paceibacterota bacterium]
MQFLSGVSRFLPSRRVGALVVVVGAFIVATLIIRSDNAEDAPRMVARLTNEPQEFNEVDTDGDGVKDWEESLRGLSATSADTDGDGVSDGQEIEEERVRLEEQRSLLLAEAGLGEGISYEGLSETERLSRGILEQVVAFKDAGISFDSDTTNDVASILGGSLSQQSITPKSVDTSLLTSVPESIASLTTYTNSLGQILGGEATLETNELLVLAQFGQTGDASTIDSLVSVIATYGEIIEQLTNTPVPATLYAKHVDFINAFINTQQSIGLLAKLSSDPIVGLQGLEAYSTYSSQIGTTFESIRAYLRTRVTLEAEDPGYIIIEESTQ